MRIYKYEIYKLDQLFLSLKPKNTNSEKSRLCKMFEESSARDTLDFDGNTVLFENWWKRGNIYFRIWDY